MVGCDTPAIPLADCVVSQLNLFLINYAIFFHSRGFTLRAALLHINHLTKTDSAVGVAMWAALCFATHQLLSAAL